MKSNLTTPNSGALPRLIQSAFGAALLPALLLLMTVQSMHAGSATWLASPPTADWNHAANWTPATIPNGPSDTATFATSNQTAVSLSATTEVNGITFNAGASAFTIAVSATASSFLIISGVGITNNSGITQNFVINQAIEFENNATAGSLTNFFIDGGFVEFFQTSTAGNGIFTNTDSGVTWFFESSSAGNSTLANGDPNLGGSIFFTQDSTGGTARVEVFGNGTGDITNGFLDISFHNSPGVAIGSLEGSGVASLGADNLTVGGNNLSTVFSGLIQDGGQNGGTGGSLTKTGKGKFTLSNANTYTGGTTVSKGTLLAKNKTGSATGTGAVQDNGGTLGGTGKISGAVTVATATSSATLAPGTGSKPGTLTLLSTLTFNSAATYKADLNSSKVKSDKVSAKGVTINNGAQITFTDHGTGVLPAGTVFTLINNTKATEAIAGTFSNLADGSIVSINGNNYQADYEGGTGNDLTLTVVPPGTSNL